MPCPSLALQFLVAPAATMHAHAADTVLPRGFFLALGITYLAALALDRLAERLRIPAAAAILLLGLALLIFHAGLGTDLRRIRGRVGAGLRLDTVGVLVTLVCRGCC